MSKNKKIRDILKNNLVPKLESAGFHGKFPEFRRMKSGDLQLLSIQFDKYGGGFYLEFANHPPGEMETFWGEIVPEEELSLAHTPIKNRARLQQKGNKNSLSENWFLFERQSADELEE